MEKTKTTRFHNVEKTKTARFHNVENNTSKFCVVSGSKKVPSGHLRKANSPSGQETLHFHLLDGQGISHVVVQLNNRKSKLRLDWGKQNFIVAWCKIKLEFKNFLIPGSPSQPFLAHCTMQSHCSALLWYLYLSLKTIWTISLVGWRAIISSTD